MSDWWKKNGNIYKNGLSDIGIQNEKKWICTYAQCLLSVATGMLIFIITIFLIIIILY